MKKFLVVIPFLLVAICSMSQQLGQVKFSANASLSFFAFVTEQGVLIRISPEGKVLEWGTELASLRSGNYFAPQLQPFMGRIDYYGPEADSVTKGKVKGIGTCWLTYYPAYETEKAGRLKTVGSMGLDYYSKYENEAFSGKLKLMGNLVLEYYPSYEDESLRGKLKSIGSTQIMYYSTFDDKYVKGKIKSIGPVMISYYTSADRQEWRGMLRSGTDRQVVNGVTYILR